MVASRWDRYTVVFTKKSITTTRPFYYQYVGMSSHPFSPQGFGQHGESQSMVDVNASGWPPAIGRKNHLGTRIEFEALPDDCKALVIRDYAELWGLNGTC